MQNTYDLSKPIVIGGVGGSGTRVVAKILKELGVYIGYDLDQAMDNLLFLLFFKRPKWLNNVRHKKNKIFTGLSVFSKAMFLKKNLSFSEIMFLFRAVFEIAINGHNYYGDGRGIWPFIRVWRMLTKRKYPPPILKEWGWKEPNTHIYIEYIIEYFHNMRYLHIIRHGLDMALSKNQQQLYNWGSFFGLSKPQSQTDEPKISLKYWLLANRRIYEIGEKLGNQKVFVINFEKLCLSPKPEIDKIVSFLNIKPNIENLKKSYSIPKMPNSMGRYKNYELSQFENKDLDELKKFGYSITPTA